MAHERTVPVQVARLLASSIETTERLDVLLHLRAMNGRALSARFLGAACSMSTAAAADHLAILCGRGFLQVSIGNDLLYAYQPLSPTIRQVVDEIAKLHTERRAEVIAALKDRRDRDPVRAFANAFLVGRGDKDKGGSK